MSWAGKAGELHGLMHGQIWVGQIWVLILAQPLICSGTPSMVFHFFQLRGLIYELDM